MVRYSDTPHFNYLDKLSCVLRRKTVVTEEMAVYYLGLNTLLVEPPSTLGALHIDKIWVIGFFALAVARPGRRVRHYPLGQVVIARSSVVDVLAGQSQLPVLLSDQHCTLALDALDVEVDLLLGGEHLRRGDVLPKLEKYVLGKVILAQHPLDFNECLGIRHPVGLDDFVELGDIGLVGIQTVELDILAQSVDGVLEFYLVVVPSVRDQLLELRVQLVVFVQLLQLILFLDDLLAVEDIHLGPKNELVVFRPAFERLPLGVAFHPDSIQSRKYDESESDVLF